MDKKYKDLSNQFRPNKIRYLLIGESSPFTPPNERLRYFYNHENAGGNQILLSSVSYSFTGQKFYVNQDKKKFLQRLKDRRVFLVDAVYNPINQLTNKERLKRICVSYPQLKRCIVMLPLEDNAKILLIHRNVIKTIGQSLKEDFQDHGYRFYDISFPRYYNDERFKNKIIEDVTLKFSKRRLGRGL